MGLKTHKPHVKTSTHALSLLTQRPRSEASPRGSLCLLATRPLWRGARNVPISSWLSYNYPVVPLCKYHDGQGARCRGSGGAILQGLQVTPREELSLSCKGAGIFTQSSLKKSLGLSEYGNHPDPRRQIPLFLRSALARSHQSLSQRKT